MSKLHLPWSPCSVGGTSLHEIHPLFPQLMTQFDITLKGKKKRKKKLFSPHRLSHSTCDHVPFRRPLFSFYLLFLSLPHSSKAEVVVELSWQPFYPYLFSISQHFNKNYYLQCTKLQSLPSQLCKGGFFSDQNTNGSNMASSQGMRKPPSQSLRQTCLFRLLSTCT